MRILSAIFPQMCGWLWFMIKEIVTVLYSILVLLVIYENLYWVFSWTVKPHNPMINAGAIMICSLCKKDHDPDKRFEEVKYRNQLLVLIWNPPIAKSFELIILRFEFSENDFPWIQLTMTKSKMEWLPGIDIFSDEVIRIKILSLPLDRYTIQYN